MPAAAWATGPAAIGDPPILPFFSVDGDTAFVRDDALARCDSASYVSDNGACIFPGVTANAHFDYNERIYEGSVEFIYDAMFHLGKLIEEPAGLYVPGGYFTQPVTGHYEPLTRNYYGDRGRDVVRAKRLSKYGTYNPDPTTGNAMDCDEYPFSSTYQNANYDTADTASTWVVRPVVADENQTLGRALGAWMTSDQILDNDQFFVAIDNAPSWPSS